jgi:hypothetical protein
MSIHVNYECYLCTVNNIRNQDNNEEILESVTDSTCVIDGVLHQHHSRGAKAFEIVASTGQVYVPHISNERYMALVADDEPASVFARFVGRLSHILIHMPIGSVIAIPTADGVMLVRLVSDPMTGAMTGRSVFSFSGSTAPYCGGAEGADTLLHVDGVLERPGSTQPFHTVHRSIEVIGYLSPGSRTYVRIMNTQQVTTTVKMLASRADIKPTLAEAMSSVSVTPASASASASSASALTGPGTASSNSSASPTTEQINAYQLCECYPGHEAQETTTRSMLAIAHTAHGNEYVPITGCVCPICTDRIGQCVQCFGSLLNDGDKYSPDDCV